jgi:Caspase domain
MQQQRRFALCIGVQHYDDPQLRLQNSYQDSQAMQHNLTERGFTVVYETDPDLRAMLCAVHTFQEHVRDHPGCFALVYFAGHGSCTSDQKHVLMCKDWKHVEGKPTAKLYGLVLEDFLPDLSAAGAVAVLLDACRTTVSVAQRGLSAAAQQWSARSILDRSTPLGQKLLVSYACEAGRTAADGPAGEHGVYTEHLLKVSYNYSSTRITALSSSSQAEANYCCSACHFS